MKILKILAPIVVVLVVVFIFAAPIGPVPGFVIGGTPTEAPANWGETSDVHEIRLAVPGSLPRVVIIWVIQSQGELYVVGETGSGWVSMLGKGGPVRMRMGDSTYSLSAVLVESGWEPVMEDYVAKYRPDYPDIVNGFPSTEEAAGMISVYQLARP